MRGHARTLHLGKMSWLFVESMAMPSIRSLGFQEPAGAPVGQGSNSMGPTGGSIVGLYR